VGQALLASEKEEKKMSKPMKRTGFSQGIYEVSKTKKEQIGALRILRDGRKFRYARAGSSALGQGKMGVAAAINSNAVNQTCPATSVGAKQLTLTLGGASTYAEDYFAGGYLHINDATGEGHAYPIESSTAVSNGTSITVTLSEGIKVALTTSSEYTLVHSPWMGVVESTTEENLPIGIPPVAVPANYYYWAQTGGPAIALISGTPAVGSMLTLAAAKGALTAINSSLDVDQPYVAIAWGTVGVDTEYKPVFLLID